MFSLGIGRGEVVSLFWIVKEGFYLGLIYEKLFAKWVFR